MGQACSNCKYKEKEGELKTGPSLHGLDQPNIGVDNAQGSVQITDNEPAAGSQQHNPKQDPSPVLQDVLDGYSFAPKESKSRGAVNKDSFKDDDFFSNDQSKISEIINRERMKNSEDLLQSNTEKYRGADNSGKKRTDMRKSNRKMEKGGSCTSLVKNKGGAMNPRSAADRRKSLLKVKIDVGCFRTERKGKQISDNYKILETLGQGAFGIVKKVQHLISGDIRALKILDKAQCVENQSMINEISILQKLDHPNILRLYEFYQDTKNYYLVVEYCGGGELFEKIVQLKSFSEAKAAHIMRQVLSAIVYCHGQKIVHRDLKPENLLLESDDFESTIKVIDFGTSRIFQSEEKMTEKFGTPYYIAPEVLKKDYSEKCDVWSCGVILFILLSGYPPFAGKNNVEIIRKVLNGEFDFNRPEWQHVSEEAKSLINKMLIYSPKKRITAYQALNDPWILEKTAHTKGIYKEQALNTFQNLQNFRVNQKFQEGVLTFIVSQLQTKEEEKKLREIFQAFDANNDGQLSREELIAGYTQLFNDPDKANREVDAMIEMVDANGNGLIDYSEFLMANANMGEALSNEKLKMAFDAFDMDGGGTITKDELDMIFGSTMGDEFNDIIKDVDQDGDGEINFEEFKTMMRSILCNTNTQEMLGVK